MDYGSKYADKQQRMIELRLQEVYREAQKDIKEKIQQFTEKHEKKAALLLKQVQEGEISEQQYKDWLAGQAFIGKRWEAKKKEIAESLLHANESAVQIVNGKQLDVFAENANYTAYQIETDSGKYDFGVNFDIYDTDTVARLIREKPELMPPRQINGKKDRAWNQGIISNAVTQSIIQGESIPELAKRLAHDTANSNMKAMVRYARTAMTCAQNAGRIQRLHEAQDMGIKVQKQWLATLDNRTRDAHAMLDGQIKDIDEPFDSELGEIMYPGDPSADPANVYNCRCTLVYIYPEYQDRGAQRRDNETGGIIDNMTYQEWKNTK